MRSNCQITSGTRANQQAQIVRVWHPEPSPGRADLRVPGRAGDVEHAELGEGGRRRRDDAEAVAAEAAVLEAAALARPAAPHGGAPRLMQPSPAASSIIR